MLSLEDRVQNGMFLLDMTVVGWDEKIDVDTLALSCCGKCVLGQLVGWNTYKFYRILPSNAEMRTLTLHRCGFLISDEDYTCRFIGDNTQYYKFYNNLTNVWKKAILERRAIRAIIADMEEFAKN